METDKYYRKQRIFNAQKAKGEFWRGVGPLRMELGGNFWTKELGRDHLWTWML